jgi:hypothetical protein
MRRFTVTAKSMRRGGLPEPSPWAGLFADYQGGGEPVITCSQSSAMAALLVPLRFEVTRYAPERARRRRASPALIVAGAGRRPTGKQPHPPKPCLGPSLSPYGVEDLRRRLLESASRCSNCRTLWPS